MEFHISTVRLDIGRSNGRSNVPFHRFLISGLSDKWSAISQMLTLRASCRQVADLIPLSWQIYPPVVASIGQEWQFHISTVRADIGRSSGRSNVPFHRFLLSGLSDKRSAISQMLPLRLHADQVADLPPIVASSGQKLWFHISTVRAHIGKSTGRSIPSSGT